MVSPNKLIEFILLVELGLVPALVIIFIEVVDGVDGDALCIGYFLGPPFVHELR